MKHLNKLFFYTILMTFLLSCQQPTKQRDSIKDSVVNNQTPKETIKVDTLNAIIEEFGMGCTTEYYKTGSSRKEMVFQQGGSKDEKGWVSFMKINGKREVFYSQNQDTQSNADGTSYTTKIENESYSILIKVKTIATHIESDSAEAKGTLTITNKSNTVSITIEIEGGTAC